MRPSVSAAARKFNEQFEGSLTWMYLDKEGYVTTGEGDLIDPLSAALALPWQTSGGGNATQAEITDAWNAVKARTDLMSQGGGAFEGVTTLRLSSQAVTNLVIAKLTTNEDYLRRYFPQWDTFPADAQLGILSMAWAMGPAFPATFTSFTAAANAGDWATAAEQSQMKPTPGIAPRNAANLILFNNAAVKGENPATLYYPGTPGAPESGGAGPSTGGSIATWITVGLLVAGGAYGVWRLFGKGPA
jgi:GH24 family phage-related lysozyme (muramidase)